MINITDKSKCCGCSACVQRCPKQCIVMQGDEEGFLYPQVDVSLCIDCGACETVCPVINQDEPITPLKVFAAKNTDDEQRLCSSSGGVFIRLAEKTICEGGVVFGARFDKYWGVEHSYAETLEELEPLMRSKYVQSRIGNAYKKAECFLRQGRKVLFVGTACQIAGLRKFLHKDYDNLLAVDVLCHGVPSPEIWHTYLEHLKYKTNCKTITSIIFRGKQEQGYEWKNYGFVVKGKDREGKERTICSEGFMLNIYLKGFLYNLYLRPSCHQCPSKDGKNGSDITLADFWGIESLDSEFADNKGVSIVFVQSEKALKVLGKLQGFSVVESTLKDATTWNRHFFTPTPYNPNSTKFWRFYKESHNMKEAVEKALYVPIYRMWSNMARNTINQYTIGILNKITNILKSMIKK